MAQHADECQARPKFIAHPAADELKQGIGNRESRKCQSQLGVAQAEISFNEGSRGRDVHAVHEQDQVQEAQQ